MIIDFRGSEFAKDAESEMLTSVESTALVRPHPESFMSLLSPLSLDARFSLTVE
jgi:hypothetical protein